MDFVADNDINIIEAYTAITGNGYAFPFGIYDGDTPVGFLMIGFDTDDWGIRPAILPVQTALTCFVNASGAICKELEENVEGMLIYDFEKQELNFGELGRKCYSDQLLNEHSK